MTRNKRRYSMKLLRILFAQLLLMPTGAMTLKIQVPFLFFFSVENVHFSWIIGFSGTRDVLSCREQIQQRDAGDVLCPHSSKSI